ncbi:Glycosomal membrane protein [Balamuthia mandrillaris]
MSLVQVNKFLALTEGRDKLYKFAQYGSRVVAWWFLTFSPQSTNVQRFERLDSVISDVRKLLRFFKFLEEIQRLRTLKETKPLYILGSIGKSFGMSLYFFFNNLSWLCKYGAIKGEAKKYSDWSMWWWFIGVLCSFLMNVGRYRENLRKQKRMLSAQELKEYRNEQKQLQLAMIRELANLQISSALVDLNPMKSKGLVGLAGVIEALLGAHAIWKRCA